MNYTLKNNEKSPILQFLEEKKNMTIIILYSRSNDFCRPFIILNRSIIWTDNIIKCPIYSGSYLNRLFKKFNFKNYLYVKMGTENNIFSCYPVANLATR